MLIEKNLVLDRPILEGFYQLAFFDDVISFAMELRGLTTTTFLLIVSAACWTI